MSVNRFASLALAAAVVALPAAVAQAQTRDSLTLYAQPDYRGASVTFYGDHANIGSTGFTDKARSAQVIGAWSVCTGGGFRGRCERLTRNVRDLSAYGLSGQVGSARRDGGPDRPRGAVPPPPPAPARDSARPPAVSPPAPAPAVQSPGAVIGLTTTFFPRPTQGNMDVSAGRADAADRFCRSQGLGVAVYFDASQSAGRAVGADGRVTGPGPVLRDVLCRRY
jgi:hypothetical protein